MKKQGFSFAYTLSGPVRVEKRAIDAQAALQRRKERKRNEQFRPTTRASKFAAAEALFSK